MIRITLIFMLLFSVAIAQVKQNVNPDQVQVSIVKGKTKVYTNDEGVLCVDVNSKDLEKYRKQGYLQYEDFGATGDGVTDDIDFIAVTHAVANSQNLKVKANDKATYYISGKPRIAIIMTDTDFGKASFFIDDKKVEKRNIPVFKISSKLNSFNVKNIESLRKGQSKIDLTSNKPCLITVTNSNVKHYIRKGVNRNNGSPQTDVFLVDKSGNVDPNTPILWDFDKITKITAMELDEEQLTIEGGNFTTNANNEYTLGQYYARNIAVRRSNVLLKGFKHFVVNEVEQCAPYGGFVSIAECANVVVKDAVFTGRRLFSVEKVPGKPNTIGTYDIVANKAVNLSFVNCSQTNDINDRAFWGIMGSNFCKNIVYDNCNLSRFDAHQGVANATIRNSTLGYLGINAIGSGKLLIENSTIKGNSMVNLRADYGSTWNGELTIRNCVFIPANGKPGNYSLINGNNTGDHNFGYVCYMPSKIIIENVKIDDLSSKDNSKFSTSIFANFNPKMVDETYKEEFPYIKTRELVLNNVKLESGKELKLSNNAFMFKDVKITRVK